MPIVVDPGRLALPSRSRLVPEGHHGSEDDMSEPARGLAYGGRGYEYGGSAFVGAIVVGIGMGVLRGDFWAWLLIGLGAGFILMSLIAALARK
jgi:hypothetical protein